jgi:hypothetical protein
MKVLFLIVALTTNVTATIDPNKSFPVTEMSNINSLKVKACCKDDKYCCAFTLDDIRLLPFYLNRMIIKKRLKETQQKWDKRYNRLSDK